MAPIKFEENIREELENRSLQPSAKSWDDLSQRLDNASVKKHTKSFWLLGIAAGFIGMLFIINGFMFCDLDIDETIVNQEVKKQINIVEEENNIVDKKTVEVNSEIKIEAQKLEENQVLAQQDFKAAAAEEEERKTVKKPKGINVEKHNLVKEDINIANAVAVNKIYEKVITLSNTKAITLIDSASVATNNVNESITVTDQELNALLSKAKKSIAMQTEDDLLHLDANELLQDVEDNLEESLRDKLFKTIKGGYFSVKSYVAERKE